MGRKRRQSAGTISELKNGTWWGRVSLGKDANGKQRRKAFYGKTRKEIQDKLTAALNDINNDEFIEPSRMAVGAWIEIWLREYKRSSVKPTTYIRYHGAYKLHIKPQLGKYQLKDLQSLHIQQQINRMINKGLSRSSINRVCSLLSDALKQAVRNGLLRNNVAVDAILPKRSSTERRVLTLDEQTRFIEVAKTIYQGEFFILALATGLRHSELLALTWEDIDFEKGELKVNKTICRLKDPENPTAKRKISIGSPKTCSSNRTVPLLPSIVEMLKKLKEKQNANYLPVKAVWQDTMHQSREMECSGFVFCNFEGRPLTRSCTEKRYRKLLKAAAIEKTGLTIHSLRHSFATRGLEVGIELKVMQELLGHSSINITANLYMHVLPNKKKSSILKLEDTVKL